MFDRRARTVSRRLFLISAGAAVLAACTPKAEESSPLVRPRTGAPLTVALANSDLALGPNRFVFAALDVNNRPIPDAVKTVRFFKVRTANTAELKSEASAQYHLIGPGDRGVYVARGEFDEAGDWGLEVIATVPGFTDPLASRVAFQVAEKSRTPGIGTPAIPTKQLTVADRPIELICSAKPPDDMHDLTIAQALDNHKPILVLLGSPGFCSSQTCGPNLDQILAAKKRVGSRVQFIHVEIYKDAKPSETVPAVDEWRLPSEPWIFLINPAGLIVDKFEGGVAGPELTSALEKLLV